EVAAFDAMACAMGRGGFFRFMNLLETYWRWAAAASVVLIAVIFWMFAYGIPIAANSIAYQIPIPLAETVSTRALEFLDDYFMEPSRLDEELQASIREDFGRL